MIRRIWGTRVEVMPIVTVAMGAGGGGGGWGGGGGGGGGGGSRIKWPGMIESRQKRKPHKNPVTKISP